MSSLSNPGLLSTIRGASSEIQSACRLPETYDLTLASDRLAFLKMTAPPRVVEEDDYVDSEDEDAFAAAADAAANQSDAMWIIKPSAMNRGRGIKVVKNIEPLRRELSGDVDDFSEDSGIDSWRGADMDVLIQRYVKNPLLVNGRRKFDVRAYCLVSRCDDGNLIAYFHEGYARVGLVDYDGDEGQ